MAILNLLAACGLLLGSAQSACAFGYGPLPGQIKNLVTFGDSYTDVAVPGDHGIAWPIFAAEDGNLTLYPFARSGATCSNNLTARPFPSVFESQLPTYFEEVANGTLDLNPHDTIYTLWIGTNDVGVDALLTGDQTPGVTVVDTVTCAVNWVKVLYENGARNFLFQNMLPLQNTVLYAADSYPNHYWTYERNTTEWNVFMTELTQTANNLSALMLQSLTPALPGAHIGYFSSYDLVSDIINHPANYLNGTAPLNVTGCVNACVYQLNGNSSGPAACTVANGSDAYSFLWYDELHPSQQTDGVIGKAIAAAITRTSDQWTTWLTSVNEERGPKRS
ncbi:GDSL lipase/acylhydrolase [Sparassis latifolia]